VPATVAVLAGRFKVGLERDEIEALAADETAVKVSARDLGWALATGRSGATTVAATVRAAHLAGIQFFATGGIGGVHRGNPDDISADLEEIARAPVAVFCAGAVAVGSGSSTTPGVSPITQFALLSGAGLTPLGSGLRRYETWKPSTPWAMGTRSALSCPFSAA